MRKTKLYLAAAVALAGTCLPARAINPDTLQNNKWYSIAPKWQFKPGLGNGAFQERGWCTMRYNSARKSLVFYEGYGPSNRGNYCIYANTLYEYNPLSDTIQMASFSNWNCVDHSIGPALAENLLNPTPMDRHTYAQFAYAPTTNKLYMAHGAMGSNAHHHDFWAYSFESGKWDSIGAAPGGSAAWECTCALNLIYSSKTDELYFFGSQKAVYTYNVTTKAWRTITPKNSTTKDIGGHGLFDASRNRFVFYGNNWTSTDVGSNTFLFYDGNTDTWIEPTPAGAWPPAKSYSPIEYNTKWDVYMLHGGYNQNDTWIYNPATSAWTELKSETPSGTVTARGTYLAYDPAHDVLVEFAQGKMWMMRYKPSATEIHKGGGFIPKDIKIGILGNPGTGKVDFLLPRGNPLEPLLLSIYDARERKVATLSNAGGADVLHWDAKRLPPGILFLDVRSGSRSRSVIPFFLD